MAAWDFTMINERWIGQDLEGSSHGPEKYITNVFPIQNGLKYEEVLSLFILNSHLIYVIRKVQETRNFWYIFMVINLHHSKQINFLTLWPATFRVGDEAQT
jgi:hypothetical protein